MRKKFGFVGGYVDAYRTLGLASLTGQAELERVLDFFAAPAVADDSTLGHFPEQVSAAAGGVFFVVRGAVAGAHQAAFFAAALAYAHAAQGGLSKAAVVVGELEVGFRFPRRISGAKAEIFVKLVGRLSR